MSQVFNFKKELDKANSAVEQACVVLNSRLKGKTNRKWEKSPLELDKLGSDINCGGCHIDIKYSDKYTAANLIIEWYTSSGKMGWTVDNNKITNYILWICTDKVYLLDYKLLRAACNKYKDVFIRKFGSQEIKSRSCTSNWSVTISKVPFSRLKTIILKEWSRKEYDSIK